MSMITVIGRGHSGTRAISHTLYASGVDMGACLNRSGDLVPPQAMYEACRVFGQHVTWQGDLNWDYSSVCQMDIPGEFSDLINIYLASVMNSKQAHRGWKIPETTLIYPWIMRLFPHIKYIFWVRNPRDCILGSHLTDDLKDFGVAYPETDDLRMRRAISWKYQYDIVQATPRPEQWIEVTFEDFVLNQDATLARLEDFLEIPLAKIIVRPDAVNRHLNDDGDNYFDFFEPAMRAHHYAIPQR